MSIRTLELIQFLAEMQTWWTLHNRVKGKQLAPKPEENLNCGGKCDDNGWDIAQNARNSSLEKHRRDEVHEAQRAMVENSKEYERQTFNNWMKEEKRKRGEEEEVESEPDGLKYPSYVFKCVKIPADSLEQVREIEVEVPAGFSPANDFLLQYLRKFVDRRKVDPAMLEMAWSGNFGRGISEMSSMFEGGGYETITLSPPQEGKDNRAVVLYLDEAGTLKNLPINRRAMQLLKEIAKGGDEPLHGDVYIARNSHSEDLLSNNSTQRHLDFTLRDIVSNSPFRKDALKRNFELIQENDKFSKMCEKQGIKKIHVGGGNHGRPSSPQEEQQMQSCEDFGWRQTEGDIEIYFNVSSNTKSRDCTVLFTPTQISAYIRTNPNRTREIEFNLIKAIEADMATWTLTIEEDRKVLSIHADKMFPERWTLLEKTYVLPGQFAWGQEDDHVMISQPLTDDIRGGQIDVSFGEKNITAMYHSQTIFTFEDLENCIVPSEATWEKEIGKWWDTIGNEVVNASELQQEALLQQMQAMQLERDTLCMPTKK
eukprot:jgi/Bigna1/69234/fgenesh1_pg.8_\